jgi:hypothetical protein
MSVRDSVAVFCDGHALQHVKRQTTELCLAAVRLRGWTLQYVRNKTPEICLAAAEHDWLVSVFIPVEAFHVAISRVRWSAGLREYLIQHAEDRRLGYLLWFVSAMACDDVPECEFFELQDAGVAVGLGACRVRPCRHRRRVNA